LKEIAVGVSGAHRGMVGAYYCTGCGSGLARALAAAAVLTYIVYDTSIRNRWSMDIYTNGTL
jgi:hypothetical protein